MTPSLVYDLKDLLAARLQMAIFFRLPHHFCLHWYCHPFLMDIAEYKWIKTGQQIYQDLAKAWINAPTEFGWVKTR